MFSPNRIKVDIEANIFLSEENYFYMFLKLYLLKIYLSGNDVIML